MQFLPALLILPYVFIILRVFISLLRINTFRFEKASSISVSVVVACRNEEHNLPLLLKDLAAQNFPSDLFEVIIVDDNSSDNTSKLAAEFKGIRNLRVIKNTGTGKKSALKSGISEAHNAIILTTDADCRVKEGWIAVMAAFFERNNPEMVIGPVAMNDQRGMFYRFQELEFLSLQGITAGTAEARNPVMCNGANLAFKKESYLSHIDKLHFGLASGDDIFLMHSLKKEAGSGIMWLESAEAIVTTAASPTIASFLRQRIRWFSKWSAYNDQFTVLTAIITFFTAVLQASLLIAGLFNPVFIPVYLTVFLLKSVADYAILFNTTRRYGRQNLMRWFIPSQIIYPFYVTGVAISSLTRISSPSPKET